MDIVIQVEAGIVQRGEGGRKDCKCGKGARGASREGHERGQEARTGPGGKLVLKGRSTPATRLHLLSERRGPSSQRTQRSA
eukprot:2239202-Pleurochrysis_carterae.AAC.1